MAGKKTLLEKFNQNGFSNYMVLNGNGGKAAIRGHCAKKFNIVMCKVYVRAKMRCELKFSKNFSYILNWFKKFAANSPFIQPNCNLFGE